MKTYYKRGLALNLSKGFTLIELLVVIAIIGLLAAVVLASVGAARSKGVDAAVKGQLNAVRSQAELYAQTGTNNGYVGLCAATQANNGLAGITANALAEANKGGSVTIGQPGASAATWNGVECNEAANGTSYLVAAPLSASVNGTASLWCVDSGGSSKAESAIGAGLTACP